MPKALYRLGLLLFKNRNIITGGPQFEHHVQSTAAARLGPSGRFFAAVFVADVDFAGELWRTFLFEKKGGFVAATSSQRCRDNIAASVKISKQNLDTPPLTAAAYSRRAAPWSP